jgi:primary-amine oxidase
MPVDYASFKLVPYGFFDRNPTLNVPASASAHCEPAGGAQCCGGAHGGAPCPHQHGG